MLLARRARVKRAAGRRMQGAAYTRARPLPHTARRHGPTSRATQPKETSRIGDAAGVHGLEERRSGRRAGRRTGRAGPRRAPRAGMLGQGISERAGGAHEDRTPPRPAAARPGGAGPLTRASALSQRRVPAPVGHGTQVAGGLLQLGSARDVVRRRLVARRFRLAGGLLRALPSAQALFLFERCEGVHCVRTTAELCRWIERTEAQRSGASDGIRGARRTFRPPGPGRNDHSRIPDR